MATSTLTLAQVEQAIENILKTGQSYSRPGLTLTHAPLAQLEELRDKLIAEAQSAGDNGRFIVSDFNMSQGGEGDDFNCCGGC
jgi:hypothetical protein